MVVTVAPIPPVQTEGNPRRQGSNAIRGIYELCMIGTLLLAFRAAFEAGEGESIGMQRELSEGGLC